MPSAAAKIADREPRDEPAITVAKPETQPDIDSALLKIAVASKTSPLKLMRDYVGLAFGPGRVTFRDYNHLRLFDTAFWAATDRRTIVGQQRGAVIHRTINYRYDWWGLLENKIAVGSYLAAYGFPIIPILAVYCEKLKTDAANVVSNEQELRAFLIEESRYPMFGKPAEGQQSLGSIGLQRYLPETQCLETRDGRFIPINEFTEQLRTHYATGYVFQKFVSPHAAIRAVCGNRLATARIMTVTSKGRPKIFRACWKIPAGANMADNFWRKGNLLAQIDVADGKVMRVLSGSGLDMVALDHHPDSNAPLIGFRIPHWQRMVDTVIEAARLMQHVPLIGWDIVALDEGPVIVEMNERPDFFLPQFAEGRGALDQELTDLMAEKDHEFAEFKKANREIFKKL